MIEVKNLSKIYNDKKVLDSINLSIEEKDIHGLIGMSGAGKSTLLRCINGLIQFEEGKVFVNNIDISTLSEKELSEFRKNIGMIFQEFSLLNRMSVYENIAAPLKCWKYKKNEIDEKVRTLTRLVGLEEKIYAYPQNLSGGQKQRVAIARALALDPKILLCDEATSALDPNTADSILSLLEYIHRELGITIVIVAHQMSVIQRICKHVTILENGNLVETDKTTNVFLKEPPALRNMLGEKEEMFPTIGYQDIKVLLEDNELQEPIISRLSSELKIAFYLLESRTISMLHNNKAISYKLRVKENDIEQVENFLESKNITYHIM